MSDTKSEISHREKKQIPIFGYFRVFKEYPQKSQIWKSQSQPGNLVGNSLVGTCLTLPNLGFLWVFFKYPKISQNGNLLFFPVSLTINKLWEEITWHKRQKSDHRSTCLQSCSFWHQAMSDYHLPNASKTKSSLQLDTMTRQNITN